MAAVGDPRLGFAMAMGAFNIYGRKPISESDIEREMRKGQ